MGTLSKKGNEGREITPAPVIKNRNGSGGKTQIYTRGITEKGQKTQRIWV
ncbi:hypothetical protein GCM10007086_08180 [Photobacterium aphoticum]|nr:hypothetical protein GCM10007086_08180 [Photobacterium aphoticum]